MKISITLLTFLISFSTYAFRVQLSASETELLKKGKEIVRVEELKNEVFPRVTLINIIPHTPHENMNLFTQFENHPKFIPGLLAAKVVNKEGNITDVAFEMEMPIVKNTKYTTRHFVDYEGKDAVLRWDLLKSKQLKATKGSIIFEEFEGKTLFTYVTHITPESSLAWTVKSRVVPDVKKNMKVVREYLAKNAGKTSLK